MLESHSPRMIEQSGCPKCEIRMMLVDVEPSFAGPDLGTLECPKCELAYKALAEGPMKPRTKRLAQRRNRPGRVRPPQLASPAPISGSFSRNHFSAASSLANTLRWSTSPTSLLVST